MRKIKANNKTKRERLEEIISLLGQGKMRFQLLPTLSEKWGIKETGVQKYLDAANHILSQGFKDEDLLAMYKEIHSRTLDEHPAIALKSLDSIAKLKKGGFNDNVTIININRDGEEPNAK